MFNRIHIFDLDGVLVDTSHRYRTLPDDSIDMDYWNANHTQEKMAKDRLLPLARKYRDDCKNSEIYTIICTVRTIHILDIAWILGYLGAPDKLYMVGEHRPPYTKDYILKCNALRQLFNLRQFIDLPKISFEDNMRTVYAFADMGIQSNYIQSNQGSSSR